jgi:hypothetical protein
MFLFEHTVESVIIRSGAHMFRLHVQVQRQRGSSYPENQSTVAQLILRLLISHVLLTMKIGIDSQICA